MHLLVHFSTVLACLLVLSGPAAAEVLDFEGKIRPVLSASYAPGSRSCIDCHGGFNGIRGSYDLRTYATAVAGGSDSTPNVIAGQDDASRLVTKLLEDRNSGNGRHPKTELTAQAIDVPDGVLDTLRQWITFDNARQFPLSIFTDKTPTTTAPPAVGALVGPAGFDCGQCHGPSGGTQGNYDTTSYDGLFGNGLDTLPNVIPGLTGSRLVTRLQQDLDANPSDPRHNGLSIQQSLVDRLRDWIASDRARFFSRQSFRSEISILFNNPPGGTGCNLACHINGPAGAAAGYDLVLYNNVFGNGTDSTPNVIVGDRNSKLVSRLREDFTAGRKHPDDFTSGAVTLTADYINRIESWIVHDAARNDDNQSPSATAGADLSGRSGILSTLTGSGGDPDPRDILFFSWILDRRPALSGIDFVNPAQSSFSFRPDVDGTYRFTLAVSDGTDSTTDSVQLSVAPNQAPIANAGPDQSNLPNNVVTLDGRGSSDPDAGDTLTYTWSFESRPVGSNVNNGSLLSAASATPRFTPDVPGLYIVKLSVSDSQLTSSDQVIVTARGTNTPPIASAGPPRRSRRQQDVQLDGRASRDPDGDPLTYTWSFSSIPAGSSVANTSLLPNPAAPTPTFLPDLAGAYVLQLIVSDGSLSSTPASVTANVAINFKPVAVAEANPNTADPFKAGKVTLGNNIQLSAAKSKDLDDVMRYFWTLRATPPGSTNTTANITPNDSTAAVAAIMGPQGNPDGSGIYSFGLVAKDGLDDSAQAFADVEVRDNFAPVADAGPDKGAGTTDFVTLDGSRTRDFEEPVSVTYSWTVITKPNDSAPTFEGTGDTGSGVQPRFKGDKVGSYTIQLEVTDTGGLTSTDQVVVKVKEAANAAPTAAAGANQTVGFGTTVTLTGAGTDPNADPISYSWTLVQKPPGSTLSTSSLTPSNRERTPKFDPDLPGDYRWGLTVNDGLADSTNTAEVVITVTNAVPVAAAGADQTGFRIFSPGPKQTAFLDGSASTDPEAQPLTYRWEFTVVPPVAGSALSNASIKPNSTQQSAVASFTPDVEGTYSVRLVVNDGFQDSAADIVLITVGNATPVVTSPTPVTTNIGNTVNLTAAGSDADVADVLEYRWSIVGVPPGSAINDTNLSRNNSNAASTTSFIPDLAGIYVLRVRAFDGLELSGPAEVRVFVVNTPPTAAATASPNPGRALEQITLDGSASSDAETADINQLTFDWFFIKVPPSSAITNANLSSRTSITPRFSPDRKGDYTVGLIVSDGFLASATATVDIRVENTPPTADAGPDQSFGFGTTIQLDGRGSFDPNPEDVVVYTWSLVSGPASDPVTAGRFTPNGTTISSRPFFTPRAAGQYVVGLVLSDGIATSAQDTVNITISNNAPSANAGPDTTAPVRTPFRLRGDGSVDPEGNPLTYSWSFASVPPVNGSTLTNASIVPNDAPGATGGDRPFFTPDQAGIYRVRLTVSDGILSGGPDEVLVTVVNTAPTANAGFDQLQAKQGTAIQLDGRASSDAETPGLLTYQWSFSALPSGSGLGSASFTPSVTSPAPTFRADRKGQYQVQLTVSDGLLSGNDQVTIQVVNSTPTANAGTDATTGVGVPIVLDGTQSVEPDSEDTVAYQWQLLDRPLNSAVETSSLSVNNSSAAAVTTFEADVPGTFRWGLTLVDSNVPAATSAQDQVVITVVNSGPIADARATPSRLEVPASVQLDGSNSSDPETPGILTYLWSITSVPAGSTVTDGNLFASRTQVNPVFVPDRKGIYSVELVVSDGLLQSAPDVVSVEVVNTTPTAVAGSDITTPIGRVVSLIGSASDPNPEDRLTYSWRFSSVPPVAGSTLTTAAFSSNDTTGSAQTSFRPDRDGEYLVRLTVSDGTDVSAASQLRVTVTNTPPTASTTGTAATQGNPVTLDGRQSTDLETPGSLTYRWSLDSKPASSVATTGSIVPNDSTTASLARFTGDVKGNYSFTLIVNDGLVDSDPRTVAVTVKNSEPVANAGPDFSSSIALDVQLDGSASTDPNPDDVAGLVYTWSFDSVPSGSAVVTADIAPNGAAGAARPAFDPDLEGEYVVRLVVRDPDGFDSAADTVKVTVANLPPTSVAGPDVAGATVLADVVLDGTASADPESFPITYSWSFQSLPSGAGSTLTAAAFTPNGGGDAGVTRFRPDRKGTFVVQLVTSDGQRSSAPDTLNVKVVNSTPTARAGADFASRIGQPVNLDGTASTDPNFEDGPGLVYSWSFTAVPPGSTVGAAAISPNDTAASGRPSFVPDRSGTYRVALTVRDPEGAASTPDEVSVQVDNSTPTASAGADRTVTADAPIALDGTASSDPDSQPLAYLWAFTAVPAGSAAGSSSFTPSATSPAPSFSADRKGAYTVRLTVSDGQLSSSDSVRITVLNSPPVANAGADRVSSVARSVMLSGSASDANREDLLVYRWSLVSKPQGSTLGTGSLSINNSTGAARPVYPPDVEGDYVWQLVVSDGTVDSAADQVTITVANTTPAARTGPAPSVFTAVLVELDGSASSDEETAGSSLLYTWRFASFPAGYDGALSNTSFVPNDANGANGGARPRVRPDRKGTYGVTLSVSDGTSAGTTQTQIVVRNSTPVAAAGPNKAAVPGGNVQLDGSQSGDADPEDRPRLVYSWSLVSAPAGSARDSASIQPNGATGPAGGARPSFSPDVEGSYVISLSVNDGEASSAATSSVRVIAATGNIPPIAQPTSPTTGTVPLGQPVSLDGSASSDLDGGSLTYTWQIVSRPQRSRAGLTGATSARASLVPDVDGEYVISLTVSDGNRTDTSLVTVQAKATSNLAPVAEAGLDQSVQLGATVALDGSQSFDPNNDPLVYVWGQISGPPATLSDPTTPRPTFRPLSAGTYGFQLLVSDGQLSSAPDLVTIVAGSATGGTGAPPPSATGTGSGLLVSASAGAVAGQVGGSVTLRGTVTANLSGTVSVLWSYVSGPESSVAILNASSLVASFTPQAAGVYVFRLDVSTGASNAQDLHEVTVGGGGLKGSDAILDEGSGGGGGCAMAPVGAGSRWPDALVLLLGLLAGPSRRSRRSTRSKPRLPPRPGRDATRVA